MNLNSRLICLIVLRADDALCRGCGSYGQQDVHLWHFTFFFFPTPHPYVASKKWTAQEAVHSVSDKLSNMNKTVLKVSLVALLVSNQKKNPWNFLFLSQKFKASVSNSNSARLTWEMRPYTAKGLRLFSQRCEHAAEVLQTDLLPGSQCMKPVSVRILIPAAVTNSGTAKQPPDSSAHYTMRSVTSRGLLLSVWSVLCV